MTNKISKIKAWISPHHLIVTKRLVKLNRSKLFGKPMVKISIQLV